MRIDVQIKYKYINNVTHNGNSRTNCILSVLKGCMKKNATSYSPLCNFEEAKENKFLKN